MTNGEMTQHEPLITQGLMGWFSSKYPWHGDHFSPFVASRNSRWVISWEDRQASRGCYGKPEQIIPATPPECQSVTFAFRSLPWHHQEFFCVLQTVFPYVTASPTHFRWLLTLAQAWLSSGPHVTQLSFLEPLAVEQYAKGERRWVVRAELRGLWGFGVLEDVVRQAAALSSAGCLA